MLVRLFALLMLAVSMTFASHAMAQSAAKIGVVDFQSALQQTKEGQAAQKKLDAAYQSKKSAIDAMETKIRSLTADYQKQSSILSDAAKKAKEEEIGQLQGQYQQAYAQSEQEMQQLYGQLMQNLLDKMKMIATQIGKEKGYTLIIEKGAVVFSMDSIDLTAELVKRYDAANGG